jgi:protein SCO1/2
VPTIHRLIRPILAALAIAAGCRGRDSATPVVAAGTNPEAPLLRLARDDGTIFDLAEERGKVVAVFFGYTHCPDLCPLTLANLAAARRRLGIRSAQVQVVFVSVDPRRDSPEGAMRYARQFDGSFIGLSGDSASLQDVQRSFHVSSLVAPDSAGAVMVAHSARVFVVGRNGRLATAVPYEEANADRLYDVLDRALAGTLR